MERGRSQPTCTNMAENPSARIRVFHPPPSPSDFTDFQLLQGKTDLLLLLLLPLFTFLKSRRNDYWM